VVGGNSGGRYVEGEDPRGGDRGGNIICCALVAKRGQQAEDRRGHGGEDCGVQRERAVRV